MRRPDVSALRARGTEPMHTAGELRDHAGRGGGGDDARRPTYLERGRRICTAEPARAWRQMLAFVPRGARVGHSPPNEPMPIRRPKVRTKTEPASARSARGRGPLPAPDASTTPRPPPIPPAPPLRARRGDGRPPRARRALAPMVAGHAHGRARPRRRRTAPRCASRTASRPTRSSSARTPRCCRRRPARARGSSSSCPTVARRALELGLSAREPSFHVFVAADPEVMIEDDIVRYAIASPGRGPPPATSSTSTTSTTRRRRGRSSCPRGQGRRSSRAMDGLIERLQEEIPTVVEGDAFKGAQAQLAHRVRGQEPRGHPPARVAREDASASACAPCTAACRRSRSSTASRSAPSSSTSSTTRRSARSPSPRRSSRARSRRPRSSFASRAPASRPRARRPSRRPRRRSSTRRSSELDREFAALGDGRARSGSSASQQALVDDWDDLVEMEDDEEQEQRSREEQRRPRARDAPQSLPGEPARRRTSRARRRPSSTTRTRRTRASSATSSGARASAPCSPTSRASARGRSTRRAAACSSCAPRTC